METGRVIAVLETSFWKVAYRAEVVANALDRFEIVVPRAVEAEILAVQLAAPRREYPDATLFRHLRAQMREAPVSVTPLRVFGPGEAEAIPLAQALNAVLLINELPATRYAVSLGIQVTSVPGVIVELCEDGVISVRAAQRKLELAR